MIPACLQERGCNNRGMMKMALALRSAAFASCLALVAPAALPSSALAHDAVRLPFTSTLSNTTPLAFGMDTESAAAALGSPLTYVSGSPGNETFVVIRMVNGDGFLFRKDPLFLQFRHGRLTGWKGDWSREWLSKNNAPLF
jgi:hypothetical protein